MSVRSAIISTVRSSADFIGFDAKHNLGFLDNPKRFNVAVTRACSLMIVVGNPAVLAPDPHWGRLLRMCIEKHAYTGVPPPASAQDEEGGGGGDGDELLEDRLGEIITGAADNDAEEGEGFVEVSQQVHIEGNEMPSWGES